MNPAPFFSYARRRYDVMLARRAGKPQPWTDDPILQKYRFTNIFREDDKVTIWLRKNVREQIEDPAELALATIVFRWFNRIEVGEAIFQQTDLLLSDKKIRRRGVTAWEAFYEKRDPGLLATAIRTAIPRGPYVTGAYIIKGADGYDKLSGVVKCIEWMLSGPDSNQPCSFTPTHLTASVDNAAWAMAARPVSMEAAHSWLSRFRYMGPFLAYEVICDWRYSSRLLDRAPDRMRWANPGPGAKRGLNRLHGRDLRDSVPREQQIEEMRQLLHCSQSGEFWPPRWPQWEMREVEHTLCEFDKYERARLGQGRPRQVFRAGE